MTWLRRLLGISHGKLLTKESRLGVSDALVVVRSIVVNSAYKRVAYAKGGDSRREARVVVNGNEGAPYAEIMKFTPIFSPNGERAAYGARHANGGWSTVLDDAQGKNYFGLGERSLTFSPDSRRFAYTAVSDRVWRVVVDQAEVKEYDPTIAGTLGFSPDGGHFVCAGWRAGVAYIALDGEEIGESEGRIGSPVFSPNSERVAYVASRENKWWVVVDGLKQREYDSIGGLNFSPDSRRVAYAAQRGNNWLVVVDGAEGKEYEIIGETSPVFSPDSAKVAYSARHNSRWLVVVDGKEGPEHDGVGKGTPIFSPDAAHVAYTAVAGRTMFNIVDGAEAGSRHEGIRDLTFGPDSQQMAHITMDRGTSYISVGGHETDPYHRPWYLRGLVFDSPTSLRALVLNGAKIIRVDVEITT